MSRHFNRQANIDKLFDDYTLNSKNGESLDEMFEVVEEFIYKALLEKLGFSNSNDEQKQLVRQKMREYMRNMDLNSPSLVDSEKILRSMGASIYKKAAQYLEKLYKFRAAKISKAQTIIASQPRKKDPLTEILARILKRNPNISAVDAIKQLESGLYTDVIIDFDEDEIAYTLRDGRPRSVNKSRIPARLARLRNKK